MAGKFQGDLETHITIGDPGDKCRTLLQEFGAQYGWKYLHIVLARGKTPSQPMLTRRGRGNLPRMRAQAEETVVQLEQLGFVVSRIKIEASPHNADVPATTDEAISGPVSRYFESHIKLLLPSDADKDGLVNVVVAHNAHLSRNALKQRGDGQEERFVTQRCYQVGRSEAGQKLNRVLDALRPLGHPILEIEEEYAIYDTNESEDNGWLER